MHFITILILFLNLSLAYPEEEKKYVNVMKKYRREIKEEKTDPKTTTISSKTEEPKIEASKKKEKVVFKKRNEKWKKKESNKNDDDFIENVQFAFLCTDLEELGVGAEKYKDFWNCEQITKYKISEKNTFDCKEQNLIIEFKALTPSSDTNIKGGVYKTIEAFLQPDGMPLLDNEQTYSKHCEHVKR